MFWKAITDSLGVFTYWETYAAALEYLAVYLVPMTIAGYLISRDEERAGPAIGCISMLIIPLLQVAAVAVFILTLSPIILGYGHDAAWGLPWYVLVYAPWTFAKLVGVMVIAAVILAFLPIVGQLRSFQTLILGGIGLVFVVAIVHSAYPALIRIPAHLIPNFGFSAGLVVVGLLMSWVGTMAAALVAALLDMTMEGTGELFMIPVGAVFGFVPVFIYGAWLGVQLRGA